MRPDTPFTNMIWFYFQNSYVITWPVKCEMKLFIHFRNSNVAPCKFEDGYVIPHTLFDGLNYFSMLGLKLIYVSKRGPWWLVNSLKWVTIGLNNCLWSLLHQAITCSNDDLMVVERSTNNILWNFNKYKKQANLRERIIHAITNILFE